MRAGLPSGGFQSLVPYADEHGDARPSLTPRRSATGPRRDSRSAFSTR